jgi:3-hydroxyisobutyrate dehydrogenase-like beta-hydroxyacid dehydrogenase
MSDLFFERVAFIGIGHIGSSLARPNGGNGDKAITLPMTIQNQQLYLGPAKLANIPRISWN